MCEVQQSDIDMINDSSAPAHVIQGILNQPSVSENGADDTNNGYTPSAEYEIAGALGRSVTYGKDSYPGEGNVYRNVSAAIKGDGDHNALPSGFRQAAAPGTELDYHSLMLIDDKTNLTKEMKAVKATDGKRKRGWEQASSTAETEPERSVHDGGSAEKKARGCVRTLPGAADPEVTGDASLRGTAGTWKKSSRRRRAPPTAAEQDDSQGPGKFRRLDDIR